MENTFDFTPARKEFNADSISESWLMHVRRTLAKEPELRIVIGKYDLQLYEYLNAELTPEERARVTFEAYDVPEWLVRETKEAYVSKEGWNPKPQIQEFTTFKDLVKTLCEKD